MKNRFTKYFIHPLIALPLVIILIPILAFYGTYLYLAPSLPNMEEIQQVKPESPLKIYSKEGVLIGSFGEKQSIPVRFKDIPDLQIKALLAAEDSNFFEHGGVNFKSLGRAIFEGVTNQKRQSGGSTITMQVAKNYFLSSERTLNRKLTEIFLARHIEQSLKKQEILELYVNKIYLGNHAYGLAAAAQVYYGKPLKQLSLAEMAMLAGLPKAPSKYNPISNPKRAMIRRDWILGRMRQLGYINQNQYLTARQSPNILFNKRQDIVFHVPYIAEIVRSELVDTYGDNVINSGFNVYTTIDLKRQSFAEDAVRKGLENYDRRHGWTGIEAKTGDLKDFRIVHDLYPAQVVSVSTQGAEAILKTGARIQIPWSSMTWARKRISSNAVGRPPHSPKDLVAVGNIIRVRYDASTKTWLFRQIPKVQGQLTAVNPQTGSIEALVGGYDFNGSKFNRSTQGWRQAGSTIKPFVYALALEKGYTPYSIVKDAPLKNTGRWRPQNSDMRFLGDIPLKRALALSRNLVSIRLLQSVGINNARNKLNKFGFDRDKMPTNLTLALGSGSVVPLQMATGYSSFANGGFRIQPYMISHIMNTNGQIIFQVKPSAACAECMNTVSSNNKQISLSTPRAPSPSEKNDNEAADEDIESLDLFISRHQQLFNLLENTPQPVLPPITYVQAPRILKPSAAFDMANMLREVIQSGTAVDAKKTIPRKDIGGKTGTTSNFVDAWFSGFHPTLVAIVWVGFDKPETLGRREYGGIAALPIWSNFMAKCLSGTPYTWVSETGKIKVIDEENAAEESAQEDTQVSNARVQTLNPPMAYLITPPKPKPSPSLATHTLNTRAVADVTPATSTTTPAPHTEPHFINIPPSSTEHREATPK